MITKKTNKQYESEIVDTAFMELNKTKHLAKRIIWGDDWR